MADGKFLGLSNMTLKHKEIELFMIRLMFVFQGKCYIQGSQRSTENDHKIRKVKFPQLI
jgi:hypothetical protein